MTPPRSWTRRPPGAGSPLLGHPAVHQKAAYQRMHLDPCCRFPASVAVALAMTRPGPHRYISETQVPHLPDLSGAEIGSGNSRYFTLRSGEYFTV